MDDIVIFVTFDLHLTYLQGELYDTAEEKNRVGKEKSASSFFG
jgi:hypothetical protein